jgi:alpha-beta hydrolase superfamily lysophospholipase
VARAALTTGTLRTADGETLYWRFFDAGPGPILACFHGLGCHGGWFCPLAERIAARGVSVFVPDQRGNGRSTGARGDIPHRRTWLADAEAIIARASSLGARPLFLQGSSAGGLVALQHALAHPDGARGLVLVSPAFASKRGVVPAQTQVAIGIASLFSPGRAFGYPAKYVDGGLTTANPESLAVVRSDPLYVRAATARFTMELFRLTREVARRAPEVRAPTLVLAAGHDLICEESAGRTFFDRLGTADKRYVRYEGAYHGLELEPPRTLDVIAEEIAVFVHARA